MADFDKAVKFLLANEGGFVDNANDHGGATNFGVSLRFLRQIPAENLRKYGIFTAPDQLSVNDIKDLKVEQAIMIYKDQFWDESFEKINMQLIASYIFDMSVLHGKKQAIILTQRAIWATALKIDFIEDDGILGDKTLAVVNAFYPQTLISTLMAERAGYMRLIAAENSKDKEFLNGWLNRCYRI